MGQSLRHPVLQTRAKLLRRNITKAEQILWEILRDRRLGGWKFRRQQSIEPYIVDFYCAEFKLIVEIDGCTHDERTQEDSLRDESLQKRGYHVMRFWNEDVVYRETFVVQEIVKTCKSFPVPPSFPPPPWGRGVGVRGSPQADLPSRLEPEEF